MDKNGQRTRYLVPLSLILFICITVACIPDDVMDFYTTIPSISRTDFSRIKDGAYSGNAKEQLYYGICHANGNGTKQDFAEAAFWYAKAALQGDPQAQRNLGVLYDCGLGVPQSYRHALYWYLLAADQNEPAAIFAIGCYPFAYRESLLPRWYGSYNLWRMKAVFQACMYVPKYNVEATFWKDYYKQKQLLHQSDALVAKAVKERAQRKDSEAQLRLALMYLQGQGVEHDLEKMRAWLEESAKNYNFRAFFILSQIYPKNVSEPIRPFFEKELLELSSEISYTEPYFAHALGTSDEHLIATGYMPAIKRKWRDRLFFASHPEAVGVITRKAEAGDDESKAFLIWNYMVGYTGTIDYENVASLYKQILKNNNLYSLNILHAFYQEYSAEFREQIDRFLENNIDNSELSLLKGHIYFFLTDRKEKSLSFFFDYYNVSNSIASYYIAIYLYQVECSFPANPNIFNTEHMLFESLYLGFSSASMNALCGHSSLIDKKDSWQMIYMIPPLMIDYFYLVSNFDVQFQNILTPIFEQLSDHSGCYSSWPYYYFYTN